MSDQYQGGVDLRTDERFEGCVSANTKLGLLHLSVALSNDIGASTTTVQLSPDEAQEIAGMLKLAAQAADSYRFVRSPAAVEMP